MMWVIEVPVTTHNDTAAICIACMVARRPHVLCLTCLENVVAVHCTLNLNPMHYMAFPCVFHLEGLGSFHTESIAISIPVPTSPSMRAPSVHHRSRVVTPSIKISADHFFERYSVPTIMTGVRKVPTSTNHITIAIFVPGVVTDRLHPSLFASFDNVLGRHVTLHWSAFKQVVVPHE
jgi:hypothetical protein